MLITIGLDSTTLNVDKSNFCLNNIEYFNQSSFLDVFISASIYREQGNSQEPFRSRDLARIKLAEPVSEQAEFPFSLVQGGSRFMTPGIQARLDRISEICYSGHKYSSLSKKQRDDVRLFESYVEKGIQYFITKNKRHFIDNNRDSLFETEFMIKNRLPDSYTWKEIKNQLNYYLVQVNNNPSHDYASIHKSSCSFIRLPEHTTANTYWSKPFRTYGDSMAFARLKKNKIRNCSFCKPR